MNDETVNEQPGREERVGFCQDCGKPLTRETVRTVGSGVFCEPCLEVRVGAAAPPYGAATPPYGTVPPPPNAGVPPGSVPPFQEPFPPVGGDNPSPVLAALLGLIPGVGAMYNGQYAKGVAHLLIFIVLQAIADHNGIMGLLVAGWVFYQAFDAYHTAKARREGLPLPDPFGLNNIGVQVGAHFRGNGSGIPPNPATNYPGWTGYTPPQTVVTPPPEPVVPPAPQAWGSVPVAPPVAPYTQTPYSQPAPDWNAPPTAVPPVGQEWANAPGYPVVPVRRNNIPGAAAWLIVLGVVFLLINALPEWRLSVGKVFPFLLMVFAGWLFVRRMLATGGISPIDGEGEGYVQRAVCWLRMPVVLFTVAVLWMLQEFDVFRFGQTWPVLVIVIGVLLLLERSVGGRIVPVATVEPPTVNGDGKGI
jgi:TM2 domain-containing membrane protein YozV